ISVFSLLALAVPCSAWAQDTPAVPLQMTSRNTVILDATGGVGKRIQYHLIHSFVDAEAAGPYSPEAKIDRAASPHFPMLADTAATTIPDGKIAIALGAG